MLNPPYWPLETQDSLLSFEQASDATTDFCKPLWVFFNLGESTVVLKFISSLIVHETPFPKQTGALRG